MFPIQDAKEFLQLTQIEFILAPRGMVLKVIIRSVHFFDASSTLGFVCTKALQRDPSAGLPGSWSSQPGRPVQTRAVG